MNNIKTQNFRKLKALIPYNKINLLKIVDVFSIQKECLFTNYKIMLI